MSIDKMLKEKEEEYYRKFGRRFELYIECTKEYELNVCEECIEKNTPLPYQDIDDDY